VTEPCVSATDVLGFLHDTLPPDQRATVERHLDACEECLELVTLAARTSIATRPGLVEHEPAAPTAPARIGRYELGELLGRGGMGVVYAAHDTQLDREVALKLVQPRLAGDPRAQVALLREAQAMARITQPNVLTVYDLGTYEDAVYLAAERVTGTTLDGWLATPRRWRAIVDAFVQAARGLEAAHAAGLVHRDFKPGNALVGGDGRVRVFDFGVVRFTDSADTGEVAGTPLYMAPEQRRGEAADARADQYAWCAALHEALFGELPTELGAPRPAMAGAANRVPRWLRELIRRGLARDPAARFPSMAALRGELERGLRRRRRRVLAGVAALAAAAALATAGLGYARGVAGEACPEPALGWTPARQLALAASFVATGLPYAPATWLRSARVLDGFAGRWHDQHREVCRVADAADRRRALCLDHHRMIFEAVIDQLAAPDRELADEVPQLLASLPDVASCARADGPDAPVDPLSRVRLALHLRATARAAGLVHAGRVDAAERAVAQLVAIAPTLGWPGAEAEASYLAGKVAALRGRTDEAQRLLEQALWTARGIGHDELALAAVSDLLGVISSHRRRPLAALQLVPLTRAAAERVGTPAARLRASRAIGNAELIAGRSDEAEADLRAALALADAELPPDDVVRAMLFNSLANLAQRRGRYPDALAPRARALALFAGALGTEHPLYVELLTGYAITLDGNNRRAEALPYFEAAVALQERALGPRHPELAHHLDTLADHHLDVGNFARAKQLLLRAAAINDAALPPDHPQRFETLQYLAEALRLSGELPAAEATLRSVLAHYRETLGSRHHATRQVLLDLAELARGRGDLAGARALCSETVSTGPAPDESDANAATCLAELDIAEGRPDRAIPRLDRAIAALEAIHVHRQGQSLALAGARFALATALPASARARARGLATAALAAVEPVKLHYQIEYARMAAWLRDHP
jgi:tetratricopeptide (TPR) repeat protein